MGCDEDSYNYELKLYILSLLLRWFQIGVFPSDSTESSREDSNMIMKLDNKQVTIQFRGGLLGIVILAARVFCFCWQVFISAGALFLLATMIHVDNESAICVVKNPVYHSKTKHIEIRHHFIRDSYEKRLIQMVKIHTDSNVTDLLTKAFDVTRTIVHIEDSPKQGRIIKDMDRGKLQETAEHSRDDDDETLTETLLNIKRSLAKDKGKGIIQELERYNLEKALELKRQLYQRKESVPKEIDWNDPQVLRYHALLDRLFSKAKDQVHTFILKDSEVEREVMKRAGFDLHQGSSKRQRLDKQTKETEEEAKAQGDSDQEVEELKLYMRIILEEDIAIKAIPLAIKPQ
nr:putative ribonuclease H-like domain-containing protein [Tanacetum cinerariifolium]